MSIISAQLKEQIDRLSQHYSRQHPGIGLHNDEQLIVNILREMHKQIERLNDSCFVTLVSEMTDDEWLTRLELEQMLKENSNG